MFEHWTQFALSYAPRVGLTPHVALNAHAMLCSILGSEWIEEHSRRTALPGRTIADPHPLFMSMQSRTDLAFVEVCEVAGYLLAFQNDPALGSVISDLRDAGKCKSALLELTIAWKLRNAGADIRLAPKTTTGVADLAAIVNAREHIIEVSGFPSDPFRNDLMAFVGWLQQSLKTAVRKHGISSAIAIELDINVKTWTDLRKIRRSSHEVVLAAVSAFMSRQCTATIDASFGRIVVRRAQPNELPDTHRWSIASCLTQLPQSELGLVGDMDYTKGQDTHWIYLAVPDEVLDPYERIRSKLKIEARQLRGCTDGVILIAVNGLRRGSFDESDKRLRVVIDSFARNHTSTTAIGTFILPRKMDGTAGLAGAYFELGATALSRDFWQRAQSIDRDRSVLWELDCLI